MFESANAEEQRRQHETALKEKEALVPFQRVRDCLKEHRSPCFSLSIYIYACMHV